MPENTGASFTGVTPMLKVFVTESLPPPVVPPLSFITTVIRFVPTALVVVLKVSVPLGTDGWHGAVEEVSARRHRERPVCATSFDGPALKPVRKLALVIAPASSATNTRFVLTAKAG